MRTRRSKKHYTADQFEKIALRAHNDDRRMELENGRVVEFGSTSVYNSVTAGLISYHLVKADDGDRAGFVLSAKALYKLAEDCVLSPNVSFISRVQAPPLRDLDAVRIPDLAVEVAMPDEDVLKKALEYLDAGTRRVWIVYTDEKTVEVITSAEHGEMRVQRLTVEDTLDGGDVLPEFSVPVKDIFPDF